MLNYLTSEAALAVGLGSIFQEVLHWYGLRQKFHLKTTRRLLASPLYWVMTILMMRVGVRRLFLVRRTSRRSIAP